MKVYEVKVRCKATVSIRYRVLAENALEAKGFAAENTGQCEEIDRTIISVDDDDVEVGEAVDVSDE